MKKLRSNPSRLGRPGERIKRTASWRDDKRTANARGYTYEWQQASKEWLVDHPMCALCLVRNRTTQARLVDHITPHAGDMVLFWNRDNWQSLCTHCHNVVKQRIERANASRTIKRRPVGAARTCNLTAGEGGGKVAADVDP